MNDFTLCVKLKYTSSQDIYFRLENQQIMLFHRLVASAIANKKAELIVFSDECKYKVLTFQYIHPWAQYEIEYFYLPPRPDNKGRHSIFVGLTRVYDEHNPDLPTYESYGESFYYVTETKTIEMAKTTSPHFPGTDENTLKEILDNFFDRTEWPLCRWED